MYKINVEVEASTGERFRCWDATSAREKNDEVQVHLGNGRIFHIMGKIIKTWGAHTAPFC